MVSACLCFFTGMPPRREICDPGRSSTSTPSRLATVPLPTSSTNRIEISVIECVDGIDCVMFVIVCPLVVCTSNESSVSVAWTLVRNAVCPVRRLDSTISLKAVRCSSVMMNSKNS